jgi:hypothetical protein
MEAFLTIAGDIATVLTAGALLSLGDAYTTREATWCLDQQTVFADVGQAMLTFYSPKCRHDIFIAIAGNIFQCWPQATHCEMAPPVTCG